jgi:glycerophosphoryl diester phosphodiesterase
MSWNTLDHSPPLIIAHRGASGLRPEHTLEGYALALEQGADVVEPDLVPSADGVLFARHDAGLARSTDIASREMFRARQDGGDWPCDALAASEFESLRAVQPFPGRSSEFDGRFALPRWSAVIDWAAGAARDRGTPVTLYPELKHPADFIARGVDPVNSFVESVANLPAGVRVWVQCFEAEPLRRVHEATELPCCLAIDAGQDWSACIREHGGWLARIGVNKQLLLAAGGADLVKQAHAAGLRVDAWTLRDDLVDRAFESAQDELLAVLATGADGLFCDFPASGLGARDRIMVKR